MSSYNAVKGKLAQVLPGSIRARLIVLISLALIPMLILLGWISFQRYETRRIYALQTELEVARGVATAFSAYLEGIYQQANSIGQAILIDPKLTDTEINELLLSVTRQSPAVRNINWTNPDGRVLASSQPEMVHRDLSVRPYFSEIRAGSPWAIGDLTQSGVVTQAPTLAIATAIVDEQGTFRGAVVLGIEPERLGELVLIQERPASGSYTLYDRNGLVVYRSPSVLLNWEERTAWRESDKVLAHVLVTGQEEAGVTRLSVTGGEWVAARVPVAGTHWVAGASRPVEVALRPIQQSFISDGLIALLVWLGALALALAVAQTISRPLKRLEEETAGIGQGPHAGQKEPAADPWAPKEVKKVRGSIQEMASGILRQSEDLRKSEERFRVLFNNRHSPMLVIDPNTRQIMDANPAANEFYGWSRDELLAMKITDINTLPPNQIKQEMGQAQAVESSRKFIFKHRLASGEIRDVEVHSGPIQLGGKELLFSIIHDITERRQAEAVAEEGKRILDALMDSVPEGITIADAPDVRIRMVSRFGQEVFGRPHQGMTAGEVVQNWKAYHPDGEREMDPDELPLVRAIKKGETIRDAELIQVNDKGQQLSLLCNAAPIRDAAGAITGGVVVWRDITQRKLAEAALRVSEEKYRVLFESIDEGFCIIEVLFDPDGTPVDYRFLEVNPAFAGQTGLVNAEGKRIRELTPNQDTSWYEIYGRIAQTGIPERFTMEAKHLGNRWYDVFAFRVGQPDENKVAILFSDISERRRTVEALSQSEARLNRSQEIAHLGSWELDLANNRLSWSDEIYRIFGLQPQEFKATYEAFLERVHPEDRHTVDEAYTSSVREGRDGYEIEHRVIRKDTGEVRVVQEKCEHTRDEAGKIIRSAGMVHDITERKRAEEALAESADKLRQSNQELQNFAFIASHDLQEPLRKIEAFSSLLQQEAENLDENQHEYLNRMSSAANRMRRMITELLNLSRVNTQGQPFVQVDLAQTVQEILSDMEKEIQRTGGEVQVEELPVIEADPIQMGQLLQNLIGNALKYHQPGSPPLVKVWARKAGPGSVQVLVQDNGIGFDESHTERIFQPFQRLVGRTEYEGTGIGLAICRKIAERHGGNITARSKPRIGSTFIITLPVHRKTGFTLEDPTNG